MKYPRTPHLPWSPGRHDDADDTVAYSIDHLMNENIVVSEKLDGECTSMFTDRIHARSEDSNNHPSRNWVKNFWGSIKYKIPNNVQIVGENVYAKHSIFYDRLDTYFYGFAAFKDGRVLGWIETVKLFDEIGIEPVPTLTFGQLTLGCIRKMLLKCDFRPSFGDEIEGFVIRPIKSFGIHEFERWMMKYVRKGHVKTDQHWTTTWVKNQLKAN